MVTKAPINHDLPTPTREFYQQVLCILNESPIPFLVGGAYALHRYTGIERHTKDMDVFVRPVDAKHVLDLFDAHGYRVELTFAHWLGKVFHADHLVDIIYSSGNAVATVDEDWFVYSVPDKILGVPIQLCPAEEMIWSKGFVMERERYDGADICHLIRACGSHLDWQRLLRRYEPHWRVFLNHLVLFGYVYPHERNLVPRWVMEHLIERLEGELKAEPPEEQVCQGTMLSREQYLVDIDCWGYRDARLKPRGPMSAAAIKRWTDAIYGP